MNKSIIISVLVLLICTNLNAQFRSPKPIGNNPNDIEAQMVAKANQFGMGNPASNTPHKIAIANGGFFMSFTNGGNVYYNPATKTVNAIYGDIFRKYGELGWENGILGYPTSDEKDSDKAGWKRMNTFDKGTIYWRDGETEVVKKSIIINKMPPISTLKKDLKMKLMLNKAIEKDIIRLNQNTKNNSYNETIVNESKEKEKDGKKCKTIYKKIEVTSLTQDVLNPDDIADLRLGAIYDLAEFKKGNLNFFDAPRNPITFGIQGVNNVKIDNVTPESIFQAVNDLLTQNFKVRPAGKGQYLEQRMVNSTNELDLAAGVSYSGCTFSASATFGYNEKSSKNKFLINYVYPVFTIQTVSGKNYFQDASINNNPNLVLLDKITYGVKLMVFYESDLSEQEIKAAFSGEGWGVKANLDIKTKKSLEETTFKVFLYGSNTAVRAINGYSNLFSETNRMLNDIVDKNKLNPLELGSPISYSLKFLNGDTAATNCNANELPSYFCVPNPNIPMDLTVNLINVKTSDYGFYGWNDAEILDENNEIVDTKTFFDFGKSANMGTTSEIPDINNPFRSVTFKQLSKATRDNGKLKLWFWINNGEQGHYCRVLGHNQSNYAKRSGNHYFVEYNLKDLMMPTKTGNHEEPHKKTVNTKADSGKRTNIDFNYNFIFSN